MTQRFARSILSLLVCSLAAAVCPADDKKPATIDLAEGKLTMQVPATWQEIDPKFRAIVTQEFTVTAVEGDETVGRVTVGGAGGGVESVINYWKAQYFQPDDSTTTDHTTVTESKVAGQQVYLVDLTGTYRGNEYRDEPVSPDYRMLGAIIATEKLGRYYVKLYGPRRTVAANEKAFQELVDSLKLN